MKQHRFSPCQMGYRSPFDKLGVSGFKTQLMVSLSNHELVSGLTLKRRWSMRHTVETDKES